MGRRRSGRRPNPRCRRGVRPDQGEGLRQNQLQKSLYVHFSWEFPKAGASRLSGGRARSQKVCYMRKSVDARARAIGKELSLHRTTGLVGNDMESVGEGTISSSAHAPAQVVAQTLVVDEASVLDKGMACAKTNCKKVCMCTFHGGSPKRGLPG